MVSTAISAVGSYGRWDDVLRILQASDASGFQLNALSFSAALQGCVEAEQWSALPGVLHALHADPVLLARGADAASAPAGGSWLGVALTEALHCCGSLDHRSEQAVRRSASCVRIFQRFRSLASARRPRRGPASMLRLQHLHEPSLNALPNLGAYLTLAVLPGPRAAGVWEPRLRLSLRRITDGLSQAAGAEPVSSDIGAMTCSSCHQPSALGDCRPRDRAARAHHGRLPRAHVSASRCRRRAVGHGPTEAVDARRGPGRRQEKSLMPVFSQHDRGLHAERQALMLLLAAGVR